MEEKKIHKNTIDILIDQDTQKQGGKCLKQQRTWEFKAREPKLIR